MFRTTLSAAVVIKWLLNYWSCHKTQILVINRVGQFWEVECLVSRSLVYQDENVP